MKGIKESLHMLTSLLTQELECKICKAILISPAFVTCCSQIIGCHTCIREWLAEDDNDTCPLCREFSPTIHDVKGLDHLLAFAKALSQ